MEESESKTSASLITKAVNRVLDDGGVAALATLVEGESHIGAKLLIEENGPTTGRLGGSELDQVVTDYALSFLESRDEAKTIRVSDFAPQLQQVTEARILFERIQPEPRIVICGAGHVGAALAKLASFLNFQATLIDDRDEFVTRQRFPDQLIELKPTDSWAAAVREAIGNGRGVSVAVVTRGHNEDEECLQAVMETSPDYVGLIGSKRRTNIVLERLREAGVAAEKIGRVHAPVGLDIGAVTPEEVALAILAEIVASRRGGQGGSLSAWRRRETRE
jgi:xanthine dehydrogenase accessory factor